MRATSNLRHGHSPDPAPHAGRQKMAAVSNRPCGGDGNSSLESGAPETFAPQGRPLVELPEEIAHGWFLVVGSTVFLTRFDTFEQIFELAGLVATQMG